MVRRPTPYLHVEVLLLRMPDNPNKMTTVFAAGVKVGATFASERVRGCVHEDVHERLCMYVLVRRCCVSIHVNSCVLCALMHTSDIYACVHLVACVSLAYMSGERSNGKADDQRAKAIPHYHAHLPQGVGHEACNKLNHKSSQCLKQ